MIRGLQPRLGWMLAWQACATVAGVLSLILPAGFVHAAPDFDLIFMLCVFGLVATRMPGSAGPVSSLRELWRGASRLVYLQLYLAIGIAELFALLHGAGSEPGMNGDVLAGSFALVPPSRLRPLVGFALAGLLLMRVGMALLAGARCASGTASNPG